MRLQTMPVSPGMVSTQTGFESHKACLATGDTTKVHGQMPRAFSLSGWGKVGGKLASSLNIL